MKALNRFQAQALVFKGEKPSGESLAIPDQARSPKQLLQLYTSGGRLAVSAKEPIYDAPDLHQMDMLDRLHEAQENSFEIQDLEETQSLREAEQKQAEAEAEAKNKKASESDKNDAKERSDTKE
jgi:hypothetical protein